MTVLKKKTVLYTSWQCIAIHVLVSSVSPNIYVSTAMIPMTCPKCVLLKRHPFSICVVDPNKIRQQCC